MTPERCEHGLPTDDECAECIHDQWVKDDQANDDDWMFDPLWHGDDQ